MQRVKAHQLRKQEEPKLVEELTKHRVSFCVGNSLKKILLFGLNHYCDLFMRF